MQNGWLLRLDAWLLKLCVSAPEVSCAGFKKNRRTPCFTASCMQEDWGELYTDKAPPTLFVLDVRNAAVAPVAGLPIGASCGQPVWELAGVTNFHRDLLHMRSHPSLQ